MVKKIFMIEEMKKQGWEIVKMQKMNNGQLYVRIRVNGVIGKFIVDTGATHNCIHDKHKGIFKIKTFYQGTSSGINSDVLNDISNENTISIGNIKIKNQVFIVTDLENVRLSLRHSCDVMVNGIIGMDLFNGLKTVIDVDNKKMYLRND